MSMSNALVPSGKNLVAVSAPPVPDIEVTAENADEMQQCQSAMIKWAKAKVVEAGNQCAELLEAWHLNTATL